MAIDGRNLHFHQNPRGSDPCPIYAPAASLRVQDDRNKRISNPLDGRFIGQPSPAYPSLHFQKFGTAQRDVISLHNAPQKAPQRHCNRIGPASSVFPTVFGARFGACTDSPADSFHCCFTASAIARPGFAMPARMRADTHNAARFLLLNLLHRFHCAFHCSTGKPCRSCHLLLHLLPGAFFGCSLGCAAWRCFGCSSVVYGFPASFVPCRKAVKFCAESLRPSGRANYRPGARRCVLGDSRPGFAAMNQDANRPASNSARMTAASSRIPG